MRRTVDTFICNLVTLVLPVYMVSKHLIHALKTLGNYRYTSHHYEGALITRLFLGGSAVFKSPLEWEKQLGDCAELDDKTP